MGSNLDNLERNDDGKIKLIDETGKQFGSLTVLRRENEAWVCACDCGKVVSVIGTRLRAWKRHCGCKKNRRPGRTLKHGLCKTPEYRAYISAKSRCTNPNYSWYWRYGGRGIEFRFKSFEEFLVELGPRPSSQHSVDRINNDGHYEPGNARWATKSEQSFNTSRTKNTKAARADLDTLYAKWKRGSKTRELAAQYGISAVTLNIMFQQKDASSPSAENC